MSNGRDFRSDPLLQFCALVQDTRADYPSSMLKRGVGIFGRVLLALILFLALFLEFERFRGQRSLSSYRAELLARGEKLTPGELRVSVADADNGASQFNEAARALTNGWASPQRFPPRMKMLPSGRALVGYREDRWTEDKTVHGWEEVESDIRTNTAVLARIRAALEMPRLNHNLDYSRGMELHLPHLVFAKSFSQRLGTACQLAIRQGNDSEARESLIAQVKLSRVMEEDGLIISELVRVALTKIARASLWEALQSEVLTTNDLLEIQHAWTNLAFAANMSRSLEGERIYSDVSYDGLRESQERTTAAFDLYAELEKMFHGFADPPRWPSELESIPYGVEAADFLKRQVYTRVWRFAWSYHNQTQFMMEMQRLTDITRRGVLGKSYAALRGDVETLEKETERSGFYDRLRFPLRNPLFTLSSLVRKGMEAETERSLVLCAIALKRYALHYGGLPDTLDSLVPQFIPAVPTDYMDGKPIRYRLRDGGDFRLFSVGADGVDDGGDGSLSASQSGISNLGDRKDLVWPSVALPEEVDEFRKESQRN